MWHSLGFAGLLVALPLHRLGFLLRVAEGGCHLAGLLLQAVGLGRLHAAPAPNRALTPLDELPVVLRLVRGSGGRLRVLVVVSDVLLGVEHNLNRNRGLAAREARINIRERRDPITQESDDFFRLWERLVELKGETHTEMWNCILMLI